MSGTQATFTCRSVGALHHCEALSGVKRDLLCVHVEPMTSRQYGPPWEKQYRVCMLKCTHLFRVLVLDMLVVVISGVVDIMLVHVASRQSPLVFTDPTPPQLRALSCLY